jgi:hypothetical protein
MDSVRRFPEINYVCIYRINIICHKQESFDKIKDTIYQYCT